MYVSLRSTRVQRFANSLAAGTRKRILGGGQAGPLRGSRWVSGNWALKRSLAGLECPLGPGRAPAPGELARAERLHSSTGRPDSGATLQTSLGRGSGHRQPAGAALLPESGLSDLPIPRLPFTWQFRHQPTAAAEGRGQRPAESESRIRSQSASHWTSGAFSCLGPTS